MDAAEKRFMVRTVDYCITTVKLKKYFLRPHFIYIPEGILRGNPCKSLNRLPPLFNEGGRGMRLNG